MLAQGDLRGHVAAAPREARCLVPIRGERQVGILQFPGQAKVEQLDPRPDIKLQRREKGILERESGCVCSWVDVTAIMRQEPNGEKNTPTIHN